LPAEAVRPLPLAEAVKVVKALPFASGVQGALQQREHRLHRADRGQLIVVVRGPAGERGLFAGHFRIDERGDEGVHVRVRFGRAADDRLRGFLNRRARRTGCGAAGYR